MKFTDELKLPSLIMGLLAVLYGAFLWFHKVDSTTDEFKIHKAKAEATLDEIDKHLEDMEEAQNAALRGECLENSVENLARQGLTLRCKELGITR